jgi:glycosyltransferase involved in cell wall biosynthesis
VRRPGAQALFSVVVPLYNKAPHVERSICSVLAQSVSEFQLLVVNDASTDDGERIVERFVDPRIRLLHRKERGPGGYAARNFATERATGEWIAFLDADDEWAVNHLERMACVASRFPAASVLASGYEITPVRAEGVQRTRNRYWTRNAGRGDHWLSFDEYLVAEIGHMGVCHTSATCVHRSLLLECGGFPAGRAMRGGDLSTWLKCVERGRGLAWTCNLGSVYHRNSVNMVTQSSHTDYCISRDVILDLLPRYTGQTSRLLKLLSNHRSIAAWKDNHNRLLNARDASEHAANYALIGRLYVAVNPLHALAWIIVSCMPYALLKVVASFGRLYAALRRGINLLKAQA